jgi:hypothetical protein
VTGSIAGDTAREVHDSRAVEWLARLGLASRGTVWFIVGLLLVSVLSGRSESTDANGALRAIAARPYGDVLLVALVIGFAGYGGWQLLTAAIGHRREHDPKRRTFERASSFARFVVYTGLAVLTARFLVPGGDEGDQTSSVTAVVLSYPGGRLVVGLVGLAVGGVGLQKVVTGARGKHREDLEQYRIAASCRRPVIALGVVGLVGRGLVLVLLGGFLLSAALRFDAREAKGLDAALQTLAQQPYGVVALVVAAVGLLAYGLWSWVEAVYRDI